MNFENPAVVLIFKTSYRVFGQISEKIKIPFLEQNLKKSRIHLPVSLYLSFIFLMLFLITITFVFVEACVFVFKMTGLIDETLSTIAALVCFAFFIFSSLVVVSVFSLLPFFRAYDRKIKIEQQLPFAVNYMAAMSIAGVSTNEIFAAMSQKKIQTVYKELSGEMKMIEIQVQFFGNNYSEALQKTASETASPLFSDFLNGARNTIISGGSFQKFIVSKKQDYQSLAASRKDKYFQTLDMLSEIYITVFLAMPLLFMILFYTLSPLSGPKIEQMSMLAYQAVPFLGIFFLLILEIINEKEDV